MNFRSKNYFRIQVFDLFLKVGIGGFKINIKKLSKQIKVWNIYIKDKVRWCVNSILYKCFIRVKCQRIINIEEFFYLCSFC